MRPRPEADRDSEAWWAAVHEQRLTVQGCADCGVLRFPPRVICARCRGRDSSLVEVSGRGRVVSWVVTHHPFSRASVDAVPYAVVLVRLDEQEDLMMYGNVVGLEPDEIAAGMPMRVVFEEIDPTLTLPQWRAA